MDEVVGTDTRSDDVRDFFEQHEKPRSQRIRGMVV